MEEDSGDSRGSLSFGDAGADDALDTRNGADAEDVVKAANEAETPGGGTRADSRPEV